MWYTDLFNELKNLGDPEKAVEMSRYMREHFPFLGVSRPERNNLYKKFYKGLGDEIDWEYVNICFDRDEREYQYLAIDYLNKQKKFLTLDDLGKLKDLIKTKSWWDSVDGFPRIVGNIILRHEEGKEEMLKWSVDENFWVRRVSLIFQLLWKEDTDTGLLEKIIINNLGSEEFFINKAIGWILRDYSKTDPRWVRSFIKKYKESMAKLSIKEGSKYI